MRDKPREDCSDRNGGTGKKIACDTPCEMSAEHQTHLNNYFSPAASCHNIRYRFHLAAMHSLQCYDLGRSHETNRMTKR